MKKMLLLIVVAASSVVAHASPESATKYKKSCSRTQDGLAVSIDMQVPCLNAAGFDLIKITSKNVSASFDNGKNWFKLYSIAGKDITPSSAAIKKHFPDAYPDYRFVSGNIHAFYGTGEESTNLCLSAESGKKVKCPDYTPENAQ